MPKVQIHKCNNCGEYEEDISFINGEWICAECESGVDPVDEEIEYE